MILHYTQDATLMYMSVAKRMYCFLRILKLIQFLGRARFMNRLFADSDKQRANCFHRT
jgi:hypothetical protein